MLVQFRSCITACQRRAFFASAHLCREAAQDPEHEPRSESNQGTEYQDRGFKRWLREFADREWKDPIKPRNWLADNTPFPANPSFRPPPPISDTLRSKIYNLYMADPQLNSIHELSARYNLSLKRVDAILRLKGLEAHWIKKKPLQTGFLYGMEQLLDVKKDLLDGRESADAEAHPRYQVEEADAEDQEDGAERDLSRQRYQRFFFENVVEGQEPIMPSALQKAKESATAATAKRQADKSAADMMPRYPNFLESPPEVQLIEREGRPSVKFIDVGGKFLNAAERMERLKAAERRRRQKDKKRRRVKETQVVRLAAKRRKNSV